jgi:hypothetical protein
MHDEHLSLKKQRDVGQREAAILDAERQLIQSLFDYGSATHPDPVLRATAWTREHAILALATATAVAQRRLSSRRLRHAALSFSTCIARCFPRYYVRRTMKGRVAGDDINR